MNVTPLRAGSARTVVAVAVGLVAGVLGGRLDTVELVEFGGLGLLGLDGRGEGAGGLVVGRGEVARYLVEAAF